MARDERLDIDEDFILSPKHGNSLRKLLKAQPNGVSNDTIGRVMDLSPEEVERIYKSALRKLRVLVTDGNDNE